MSRERRGYSPFVEKAEQDQLLELREILNQEPSGRSFEWLVDAIDSEKDLDEKQVLVDYIREHLESWPDKVRQVPMTIISDFYGGKKSLEELSKIFEVSKSVTLWRSGHFDTDLPEALSGIKELAGSEELAKIPHIAIQDFNDYYSAGDIRPEDVLEVISEFKSTSSVLRLDLEFCDLGDVLLSQLFEDNDFNLKELELNANSLGDAGKSFIFTTEKLKGLESLSLKNNIFDGGKEWVEVAAKSEMHSLKKLNLENTQINDDDFDMLLPLLAQLEELNISENELSPNSLRLINQKDFPKLKRIKIDQAVRSNDLTNVLELMTNLDAEIQSMKERLDSVEVLGADDRWV